MILGDKRRERMNGKDDDLDLIGVFVSLLMMSNPISSFLSSSTQEICLQRVMMKSDDSDGQRVMMMKCDHF